MSLHDLNKTLENWVKKHGGFSEDDLNKGLVRFEIDTKKLRVITTDKPLDPKDEGGKSDKDKKEKSDKDKKEESDKDKKEESDKDEKEVDGDDLGSGVVFKSKYTNKTGVPQEHTFIMNKQTEATVTSTLTKGFTTDGIVGIKVKVPDVVSNATSTFGTDVSIAEDDMSIVKHLLDWSSQNKVNVAPGETIVTELRISETKCKVQFNSTVAMKGRVLARVYRPDRQNPKVMELPLATILSDDETVSQRSDVCIDLVTGKVTWDMSGSLHFRFGVSQDCVVYPLKTENPPVTK